MTPSLVSKPSISTSSWFSVCSRSSWPPPRPAPRCRPTASISSMKMMHGACFLPCSKRSRPREAPPPPNISTNPHPGFRYLRGSLEEVDYSLPPLLAPPPPRHILEGDLVLLLRDEARAGLAE